VIAGWKSAWQCPVTGADNGLTMKYWVYENTIHQKARVHRENCSFCQSGRGLHGGGTTRSGRWFGPYTELSRANQVAESRKQPDTRACGVCIGGNSTPIQRPGRRERTIPADLEAHPWDESNALGCSLGLEWLPVGRVALDERGRLQFPRLSEVPGIYRFRARTRDGKEANYIGETENLDRRLSQNYRHPAPRQQTSSASMHGWFNCCQTAVRSRLLLSETLG